MLFISLLFAPVSSGRVRKHSTCNASQTLHPTNRAQAAETTTWNCQQVLCNNTTSFTYNNNNQMFNTFNGQVGKWQNQRLCNIKSTTKSSNLIQLHLVGLWMRHSERECEWESLLKLELIVLSCLLKAVNCDPPSTINCVWQVDNGGRRRRLQGRWWCWALMVINCCAGSSVR